MDEHDCVPVLLDRTLRLKDLDVYGVCSSHVSYCEFETARGLIEGHLHVIKIWLFYLGSSRYCGKMMYVFL